MGKNHLKSLATPRTWPIHRKKNVYVTRPNPGAHSMNLAMPLNLAMKELMKLSRTRRESKFIIKSKTVLVDGKERHDEKLPVGFMDTVSLPDTKDHYRITLNQYGKLGAVEIDGKEANQKLVRIDDKRIVKGGKIQLNLSDGRTLLLKKDDYTVGDSLLLELPSQKVKEHFPLTEKTSILLIGGKHRGDIGKVKAIEGRDITYESEKSEYQTKKKYAFVIGKDKASIKIR